MSTKRTGRVDSPSNGEPRRLEILATALALFNETGTQSVSTNHIAKALDISVGNLYWHFRDKTSIVRALYAQHHARFDDVWGPPQTKEEGFDVALQAMQKTFEIAWDYRFMYRELSPLVRADPSLRETYQSIREARRTQLRAFLRAFADLGILALPKDEAILDRLDDLGWMISTFWLPHVELREGTLNKRAVLEGVAVVLGLYRPYVTRSYQAAFDSMLATSPRA